MNTIEAMQMTAYDLKELQDENTTRDEIINDAINALDMISFGRGYGGETIDGCLYAQEAVEALRKRWDELKNVPI